MSYLMNFKEQNGGKMSQVNWNGFINKFGDNCHTKFEEMTRKIFRIGVLKDATRNLIGLSNSPGIEVEPVEFEGQKISFQSKFFTERDRITEKAVPVAVSYCCRTAAAAGCGAAADDGAAWAAGRNEHVSIDKNPDGRGCEGIPANAGSGSLGCQRTG